MWDEENSKWLFSVTNVVGVLNEQDDITKNRNYWKYLKSNLGKCIDWSLVDKNKYLDAMEKSPANDKRRYSIMMISGNISIFATNLSPF